MEGRVKYQKSRQFERGTDSQTDRQTEGCRLVNAKYYITHNRLGYK